MGTLFVNLSTYHCLEWPIWKPEWFLSHTFWSVFKWSGFWMDRLYLSYWLDIQMGYENIVPQVLKQFGNLFCFTISKPDHSQKPLFLTIWKPVSGFRIPTVILMLEVRTLNSSLLQLIQDSYDMNSGLGSARYSDHK